MHVDSFRVIRQVFVGEKREQPRLGRSSLVLFILMMLFLWSIYVWSDGRVNRLYALLHFAIIGLSLAHIIWLRRFNMALSFSFSPMGGQTFPRTPPT
jgi:hypothetical protein